MILSVDPGVNCCGVAAFAGDGKREPGALLRAGLVAPKRLPEGAAAWSKMAEEVCRWSEATPGSSLDLVLVEFPRIYQRSKLKHDVDPEDILRLGALVGALSHAFRSTVVGLVRPDNWKGQTPKAISVERTKGALSLEEKARIELPTREALAHNVYDAIGIGLYWTRRTTRPAGLRPLEESEPID